MSTGAPARPTASRSSVTSRRTCAGLWQFRWKRMKPSGLASQKKSRSAAASVGPAQPKMTAAELRFDKEAADPAAFQLVAATLRLGGIGDGPGLDAVEGAALAEIDPRRREAQAAQKIGLALAQPLPSLLRVRGGSDRAELEEIALPYR